MPPNAEAPASTIDYRQVYFNAVLGGLGGLLGWAVQSFVEGGARDWNAYLRQAIVGPLLGVCIGFAIGTTEGIIASRSWRRALRGGGYGAALGAVGGLVGLVLGEVVFNLIGSGGVYWRALSWAIFGGFVGTSDGFAQQMPDKIRYGILGGILGGAVGGSTFDGLRTILRNIDARVGLAWGSALGTILVGACIGALIGLVESILRKSHVRFIRGRLEGQTRTVDSSRPRTVGSATNCAIVIPEDATIAPVHAEFVFQNEQFSIRPRDGQVIVSRDGRETVVAGSHVLAAGDRIHIGNSKMIFRTEEGRKP